MHRPVLLSEAVDLLNVREGGRYIDGTLGAGGHAAAILARAGRDGFLLGIDRDEDALARASERLAPWRGQYQLVRGNFAAMREIAEAHGLSAVDGIILDVGVSSEQLESAKRGFSFQQDGPLDMRMDTSSGKTAEDYVNELSEGEIRDALRTLGEEPRAGRIARAIVGRRAAERIARTAELADIVAEAQGGRHGRIHPATKTFQALRILVNRELESLETGLAAALNLLREEGRLAVISFHSLEDRIVKVFFAQHAGRWESLQAGGQVWRGLEPRVKPVTRKPIIASAEEIAANARARSAKLRVAERLAAGVAG